MDIPRSEQHYAAENEEMFGSAESWSVLGMWCVRLLRLIMQVGLSQKDILAQKLTMTYSFQTSFFQNTNGFDDSYLLSKEDGTLRKSNYT